MGGLVLFDTLTVTNAIFSFPINLLTQPRCPYTLQKEKKKIPKIAVEDKGRDELISKL